MIRRVFSSAGAARLIAVLLIYCAAMYATSAMAQPQMQASRLSLVPKVDGDVLGDEAWQGLPYSEGFHQVRPVAGQPASQITHVYVAYSDRALHIGVVCFDDNPAGIVVTDSRRDSSLDDTDSFQVLLDVFDDDKNGFVFGTTPSGVEYDGQVTNEGSGSFGSGAGAFNLNWDTSWRVASRVGDYGWSAEFEIPFTSLRYGSGSIQTWGINFQRNIRRNNEIAYWAPLSRQFNLYRVSAAGSLRDLHLPPQRNFKIMPYALGRARRGGELSGTQYDEEFGFDAKYSITPSLTLDVTYNTDFAQVEVDEIQVNLDRFGLFFPEKRPFFLENAGQFSVGTPQELELFFSRRIGVGEGGVQTPIDGGIRLSGKVGTSTNVGLLHMQSEQVAGLAPANDYTVARINQELPNRSSLGAIFVNREGDGSINGDDERDYNRSYAVDGQWGMGDELTLRGYLAQTETPGRRGADQAYHLKLYHDTTAWNNSIGYTRVGENFNPEVGFLRRTNYEKGEFLIFNRRRVEDFLGLYELRPHVAYRGYWDDEGFYESGFLHVDNHWEWHNGLEIHTGVNFLHEGVKQAFEINRGTFVQPGEYDDSEADLVFQTDEAKMFSLATTLKYGGFFGGDRTRLTSTFRFRSGERFSSELTWDHNDIDLPVDNGAFEVNVARMRLSYSFTPRVLLQALVQYDDRTDLVATNVRFAWLQSANAGLYLVYNEIDDETVRGPIDKRREIALKFSRIFDLL